MLTDAGRPGKQRDGLIGGSRRDFTEALGEAVYGRIARDQPDSIIAA